MFVYVVTLKTNDMKYGRNVYIEPEVSPMGRRSERIQTQPQCVYTYFFAMHSKVPSIPTHNTIYY